MQLTNDTKTQTIIDKAKKERKFENDSFLVQKWHHFKWTKHQFESLLMISLLRCDREFIFYLIFSYLFPLLSICITHMFKSHVFSFPHASSLKQHAIRDMEFWKTEFLGENIWQRHFICIVRPTNDYIIMTRNAAKYCMWYVAKITPQSMILKIRINANNFAEIKQKWCHK